VLQIHLHISTFSIPPLLAGQRHLTLDDISSSSSSHFSSNSSCFFVFFGGGGRGGRGGDGFLRAVFLSAEREAFANDEYALILDWVPVAEFALLMISAIDYHRRRFFFTCKGVAVVPGNRDWVMVGLDLAGLGVVLHSLGPPGKRTSGRPQG
jgi:hypothetical protein